MSIESHRHLVHSEPNLRKVQREEETKRSQSEQRVLKLAESRRSLEIFKDLNLKIPDLKNIDWEQNGKEINETLNKIQTMENKLYGIASQVALDASDKIDTAFKVLKSDKPDDLDISLEGMNTTLVKEKKQLFKLLEDVQSWKQKSSELLQVAEQLDSEVEGKEIEASFNKKTSKIDNVENYKIRARDSIKQIISNTGSIIESISKLSTYIDVLKEMDFNIEFKDGNYQYLIKEYKEINEILHIKIDELKNNVNEYKEDKESEENIDREELIKNNKKLIDSIKDDLTRLFKIESKIEEARLYQTKETNTKINENKDHLNSAKKSKINKDINKIKKTDKYFATFKLRTDDKIKEDVNNQLDEIIDDIIK